MNDIDLIRAFCACRDITIVELPSGAVRFSNRYTTVSFAGWQYVNLADLHRYEIPRAKRQARMGLTA